MSLLSADLQARLDTVTVSSEVLTRWPDYRVLAIVASGLDILEASGNDGEPSRLSLAEATIRQCGEANGAGNLHIEEWMDAYRAFGAKPKRTSPSVVALLRRVEAGLPRIDPVTDLYNAISIAHALPIGGEDFDRYVGAPRLAIASGDEDFDTTEQGEPVVDHPAAGEVIWRDDLGVTCRRWNWRQGIRTRILPTTTTALFLLEALGAMSDADLAHAGAELMSGLRELDGSISIGYRTIGGQV